MPAATVPVAAQPWRIAITLAVFAGLFAVIAVRLHHLQIKNGEMLAERGERQRLHKLEIMAARGNLTDASGVPLAVSEGRWALYADPGYMDDRLRATVELSRILGIPRDELRKQFEARFNGRRIAHALDDETAEAIRAMIKPPRGSGQSPISGLKLKREFVRSYPEGGLAAHVLGFVLDDGSGGAGIEQQLDTQLLGVKGYETIAIDALGAPSVIDHESRPARPGAHVQLTLDVLVQRELEKALGDAVLKHRPTNACGIVIRPATGEVVALASWPTFEPTKLADLKPEALRNNVLNFVYEPGSTMKPLVAGAAVSDRLVSWNESIFCENGRWTYRAGRATRTITDHSLKHGGHQQLTIVQGIALSDNILMAKLGLLLGPERLHDWIVDRFGFGRRTGITLPGEDRGIVLAESKWSTIGSCLSVPMGHEIAVTPLQMAMGHAAVANGGMWLPPRLIKRVWQDNDGVARELPVPTLPAARRMFERGDAAQIQDAMARVMDEGTGKNAQLIGYTSAGKTGTSEKLVDGRYSKEHHVGSFVCWAPASPGRTPEFLALVVINDPTANGHYGSETAAPVVQRVLQFALDQQQVPQDQPVVTAEVPAPPRRSGRAAR